VPGTTISPDAVSIVSASMSQCSAITATNLPRASRLAIATALPIM
jgi:hypothetical protein